MTAAAPPVLSADLTDGLRRLKLAAMRRLAPELLVTAKTQRWSPEELLRTLAHVDFLDAAISDLDTRLDQVRHPLQEVIDRVVTIPGVSTRTAVMLLAECDADMTAFPTAAHLASWARDLPGQQRLRR